MSFGRCKRIGSFNRLLPLGSRLSNPTCLDLSPASSFINVSHFQYALSDHRQHRFPSLSAVQYRNKERRYAMGQRWRPP